jgi:hypothetical protein
LHYISQKLALISILSPNYIARDRIIGQHNVKKKGKVFPSTGLGGP